MSPITNSPRTRSSRRPLVGLAVAAALVAGVATETAAAVSWEPSRNYTSFAYGVPPTKHVIGDCSVWVGPVRDPDVASPSYRKIAGVQVVCQTRKNVIESYVALQKWEGDRWVQKGTRGYGILFDSFGSGNMKKGSQPVCGGAGGYWRTLAQVKLGSNGAWWNVPSTWAQDPAGC